MHKSGPRLLSVPVHLYLMSATPLSPSRNLRKLLGGVSSASENHVLGCPIIESPVLNKPPQDPEIVYVLWLWVLLHLSSDVGRLRHHGTPLLSDSGVCGDWKKG